jgi:hypothetical protein
MVKVAVALVVVLLREMDDGLTEQPIFAVEDERLHERVTVPLNPLIAKTVIVEVADCPDEEMVTLAGLADIE